MFWHHCHLGNVLFLLWVMHSLQIFCPAIHASLLEPFTLARCYLSEVFGGFADVPLREVFLETVSS